MVEVKSGRPMCRAPQQKNSQFEFLYTINKCIFDDVLVFILSQKVIYIILSSINENPALVDKKYLGGTLHWLIRSILEGPCTG